MTALRRGLASLAALGVAAALLAGCAGRTPPPVTPKGKRSPSGSAVRPGSPPSSTAPAPQQAPKAPAPAGPASVAPAEAIPENGPTAPIVVKVGLASDLASITLPCCESGFAVQVGDKEVAAVAPLLVEPAAAASQQGYYRLQVAALRDESQAQDLANRLAKETGQPGEAHFDAGIDLYRVRVGRYPTREAAERDLKRLTTIGVNGAFVVSDGGSVASPALRVTQGATAATYPGRWLAVAPAGSGGIRVQGKRYRGRILVYLNDRGSLNLIDELPVEDYLRGVVPSEMGPEQYNQLEALKAQAVAARTYTLRNLGEFDREGYDICATPRCQVYGGMDVEHALTDRAVQETAGQVLLYKGELVDALYSSTCGGHTEDGAVMFPLAVEPYLKGVPCMEGGFTLLAGDLAAGALFPAGLTQRLLPASGGSAVQQLAARVELLARLAGLPPVNARLASLDRREVQRFVAATFDLALDARLLLSPQDVAYLLADPPPDWTPEELARAAYLLHSGLLTGPLDRPLKDDEIERMLLGLSELLHVLRREEVSYLALVDGQMTARAGKEQKTVTVPREVATFRRRGPEMASGSLGLVPGDRVTLFWQADRLVAVAQDVDLAGVAFDRSSSYSAWTRFHTDSQLATSVATRFPGLGFKGFEILERGGSGRVGKIRIDGDDGKSALVSGLAVRWTLDVPDTLFTAKRLEPAHQEPGWLFTGRGWGHGVGMCQVGAYGMAQRGHTYRDILYHYYTGVELGRVRVRQPEARGAK
ncbi:MAG TPA: SpoIID/LytB domain-containing protein [Thermoanaerobaculia bacterium]